MKELYLTLMEKTLGAYSNEDIIEYFDRVKSEGLTEHGFPRLAANIGILISHGKRCDLWDIFLGMMDFCCENIPYVDAANNFSVREILFAIDAVKGMVGEERVSIWMNHLAKIIPESCYVKIAKCEADRPHNLAAFAALSEAVRIHFGISDRSDFVDLQLSTQIPRIDENGMYRDPHEPMVYDVVTRVLFASLLDIGYQGKYRDEIDAALRKAGPLTLSMQSVTGEIAYGGRSNAFLHNEASLAALLEYEAKRYIREGDIALAKKFKSAAKLALDNLSRWLSYEPITHIKNRFPRTSKYGCEYYAYFDKYMITTASFLYTAYLMCDDSLDPDERQGSAPGITATSPDFHKIFLACGDYYAEIDTAADKNYDCNGIGRLHRSGAPSALCINLPCTATPKYTVDGDSDNISISTGIISGGKEYFEADFAKYNAVSYACEGDFASLTTELEYENQEKGSVEIKLSADGLSLGACADNTAVMLPAFFFDGAEYTEISHSKNTLTVKYRGWICRYTSSVEIYESNRFGRNRNGYYKAYIASAPGKVSLSVEIFKA